MRFFHCHFLSLGVLLTTAGPALAQSGPFSLHTRAFIARYHCTNQGQHDDPASAYFFTPSLGGNGDAVLRYRPDSSRFFLETGATLWLWKYRLALDTRDTRTRYHGFIAGRGGASVGIPLRVGYGPVNGFSVIAGAILLHNTSGGTQRFYGFQSTVDGETLVGEAEIVGRSYTSLALDLTASFQLSHRFDVLLRGGMDTRPDPAMHAQHSVTRNGLTRLYSFDGAPKLAFVAVGAGFHF